MASAPAQARPPNTVYGFCCVALLQQAEGETSPNHTPESYPLKRMLQDATFLPPFVLSTASTRTTASAAYYEYCHYYYYYHHRHYDYCCYYRYYDDYDYYYCCYYYYYYDYNYDYDCYYYYQVAPSPKLFELRCLRLPALVGPRKAVKTCEISRSELSCPHDTKNFLPHTA